MPAGLSARMCFNLRACFFPLTVLVCLESLGIVSWQQLQEQVAGVCCSQRAAVFQHPSPRVGLYAVVYAASLGPAGRILGSGGKDE